MTSTAYSKTGSQPGTRPLRVLHAPVNVGNQPWSLSRAERRLGLKSDLVTNYQTWLGYPADRVLSSIGDRSLRGLARRTLAGLASSFSYDVVHYYFGRSLLYWDDLPKFNRFPFADLHLARRLGRRVFMTLQGCDVRLAHESNKRYAYTPCAEGRCTAFQACLQQYDKQRHRLIDEILPLCDRIFYLNPEIGRYVPSATFLPYANVDIDSIEVIPPRVGGRPRIVHSPSDASLKGTALILDALEKLKSSYDFELILVQNKSHSEAMEIYKAADIAVDQVLFGWYGGFSVEIMAMGKPVACYIREEDLGVVPRALRDELPVLRIHPETLVSDLARILDRRDEWVGIGAKSRAFAERWHDPNVIAARMVEVYRSPASALFD